MSDGQTDCGNGEPGFGLVANARPVATDRKHRDASIATKVPDEQRRGKYSPVIFCKFIAHEQNVEVPPLRGLYEALQIGRALSPNLPPFLVAPQA